MTGRYFLGRVRRGPSRGDSYYYATVEPLVESDPNGAQWVGPVRDAVNRFPARGFVHWHEAPLQAQAGTIWQFTVEDQPTARDRREHFLMENVDEPIEVLDLRAIADETALRSNLTGEGIRLSPPPLARRLLLWLASGECVGPLFLKSGSGQGLWTLDTPESHRDASRMPVWRLSPSDINRATIDRNRFFVSPHLELGLSAGIQNWASDAQVARSILARLRKMDAGVARAIIESDRVFREYLERIETGRLGGGDPDVERARADRLRGLRFAIQRDAELLKEAAEALMNTNNVRVQIDRQVEQKVSEEVQSRRADIELALDSTKRQLSGLNAQLTEVQAELERKRAEDETLSSRLAEKRLELDEAVATFDRELSRKLQEVARKPEAAFADVAVMRALLAPGPVSSAPSQSTSVRVTPSLREFAEGARQLADDSSVRAALAAHAIEEQLSLHAMMGLHATFIAGATPVILGSSGYDLLRAYARAVAGGRLLWIPVGSSAMEPESLLGRYDGASGRILPAACGLLDVVRDATQSGRLHVVVLEGFNRAPCETYLAPILEVVRAARVGDQTRTIPLAVPGVVAKDDPYRDLARLAWPPSVLIACLPTDGSATLPVSSAVWKFLALLDAEDRDRRPTPLPPARNGTPEIAEISPTQWKEILARFAVQLDGDHAATARLGRTLLLSVHDANDAARLSEILGTIGLSREDATDVAVASILVPRTSADAQKVEEAIRAADVTTSGWRTALVEAQRLRI